MSLYGNTLYTRRLALSKIQETDIPAIVAWSQSETACNSYLTPEQYLGELQNELSDQYSYCLTLAESLKTMKIS